MKLIILAAFLVLFVAACTTQTEEQVQDAIVPLPPLKEPAEEVVIVDEVPQEEVEVIAEPEVDERLEEIKKLLEDDLDDALSDLTQLE